ncbi:arrestin domain-containing protein 3-like isoform X1 [Corythoichthys intestinalis]|uniref:arrestin domain-containing protein 3-like isoform X1 n=1 Tax=Corythoichthys intestinalis TaxID=161448 RepID=UPI0025A5C125|nr:arrestin domain-containing protein 3-like isoform X1 [Corythoichthys intestinalis]
MSIHHLKHSLDILMFSNSDNQNIFTNGDIINGRIIVEVSKETQIQSLIFIGKGSARVRWHERHGKRSRYYWSDEKYYEIKQNALKPGIDCISKGRHVFPFSFKVPNSKMPSTFKSSIGRIVHKLTAELKQSMKLTKTAKAHFTFVSKADMDIYGLMDPQHDSTDKTLKVFGSGTIAMDVYANKMGYQPGEAVHVKVEIHNQSSREVKPKFELYEKQSFFAQGRRRLSTYDILKEKVESVDANDKGITVEKVITIPRNLPPSILNSTIIKLEYRLKVVLDVKYAIDPVVKLPIVVLPAFEIPRGKEPLAPAAYGFQEFGNSSQQTWSQTPQPFGLPPPYEEQLGYPTFSNSDKYGSYPQITHAHTQNFPEWSETKKHLKFEK